MAADTTISRSVHLYQQPFRNKYKQTQTTTKQKTNEGRFSEENDRVVRVLTFLIRSSCAGQAVATFCTRDRVRQRRNKRFSCPSVLGNGTLSVFRFPVLLGFIQRTFSARQANSKHNRLNNLLSSVSDTESAVSRRQAFLPNILCRSLIAFWEFVQRMSLSMAWATLSWEFLKYFRSTHSSELVTWSKQPLRSSFHYHHTRSEGLADAFCHLHWFDTNGLRASFPSFGAIRLETREQLIRSLQMWVDDSGIARSGFNSSDLIFLRLRTLAMSVWLKSSDYGCAGQDWMLECKAQVDGICWRCCWKE